MDSQWLKAQFELHPKKTKTALAKELGLEPPAVSKIINGTRQIKATEYMIMRRFFGLPSDGGHALGQGDKQSYVVESLNTDRQALRSPEHDAQAEWIIPAHIMEKHTQSSSENLKNFRVEDNMMAPEFHKDEHVIVDVSDQTPSPPGSFIVSDGFGFMLRHCEFVPGSEPPQVKITAIKDTFQSQKLTLKDFQIIGRVIAKLQWL